MNLRISTLAVFVFLGPNIVAAALPFRTLALSGEQSPGTEDGVVFSTFPRAGVINEQGTVVFEATLTGPGLNPNQINNGLWKDIAGSVTLAARAGKQAPDLPLGVNYGLPGPPRVDGAGRIAFLANAPGESTQGVYSAGHGPLRLLGREGDQVPGQAAGVHFDIISLVPLMNDVGDVAFTSFIQGPGAPFATEALFADRSGTLQMILRNGSPAPGIPGANILHFGSNPVLNDNGVLAFAGRYTGGVYPNDNALWTEQSGTFTLVARSGQAPSGMPAGVVLGQLRGPRINNAGQLMFQSSIAGAGITDANDSTLWLLDGADMRLIAREGSAATGLDPATNFGDFSRWYLNGSGEATIVGSLSGPGITALNDTAIWSQDGDSIRLIAREGDPAPGAPTGVTFADLSSSALGLQVNNSGQVAFEANLTGDGITTANNTGIWVTDLTGSVRLVTREGDLFDVNDDPTLADLRTVAFTELEWYSGGGEDGYGSSFNNAGELVIALRFNGFSGGAFVINTAVPEPSSVLLLVVALPLFPSTLPQLSSPPATRGRVHGKPLTDEDPESVDHNPTPSML